MFRPLVAVTLGDPRGIGPEVALSAIGRHDHGNGATIVIVTPEGAFSRPDIEGVVADYSAAPGTTDREAGAAAARSIEVAVAGARAGTFHAIVTGPVHKPSLRSAGWDVPGQTEMLGQLTGSERVGMLMVAERTRVGAPLRVLLATTHLPLRDVAGAVDERLIVEQVELLHAALRDDLSIPEPRLGLCALNPHASDDGLFGNEEALTLSPAVDRLRDGGIEIVGPVPADTVFTRALQGEFDAVVAPYHDVGMAAFKTVAFGTGVNVTLGLPFIRTSPDHGTAFPLTGTGRADDSSMSEALQLAIRMSRSRFDTPSAGV